MHISPEQTLTRVDFAHDRIRDGSEVTVTLAHPKAVHPRLAQDCPEALEAALGRAHVSTRALGPIDHKVAVEAGGRIAPQVLDPQVDLEGLADGNAARRRRYEGMGV